MDMRRMRAARETPMLMPILEGVVRALPGDGGWGVEVGDAEEVGGGLEKAVFLMRRGCRRRSFIERVEEAEIRVR